MVNVLRYISLDMIRSNDYDLPCIIPSLHLIYLYVCFHGPFRTALCDTRALQLEIAQAIHKSIVKRNEDIGVWNFLHDVR